MITGQSNSKETKQYLINLIKEAMRKLDMKGDIFNNDI